MIGGLPEASPAKDLLSAQRRLGIGIGDKPVVETEFPADGGFGAAAMRGARSGRLENKNGGPVPLTRIAFRATFDMGVSSDQRTGTRLRGN